MMGYGGNSAPVAAPMPPTTAPPPTANTMASQNPFDDFPQQQMNQVPQQQPMGYAYNQGQQQPQYYQQQAQQQPWNNGGY